MFARQPHALQLLQASHQQHTLLPQLRVAGWLIDLVQPILCFTLQRAIQASPPLLIHLAQQGALDLQLGARPQPFRGQLCGALTHASGDVRLRNNQVLAGVFLAAQHDMCMRVVGVPVVHSNPV